MADNRNSRDLAITEGRFALVLDRTKGHVETLTGPYKSSLADTQTPVIFHPSSPTGYRECDSPQEAVQPYIVAKQGQYVVLYNPSKEKEHEKEFPPKGKGSLPSTLDIGNAINITGPVSFALWWQQEAEVISSHQLRSNQFLLVEVTNEEQAKLNWKKAEIKPVALSDVKNADKDPDSIFNLDPNKFTLGQRIIVRGLEISSFIPPTGMRVIPDEKTRMYVREAATLESQQYCVLRSENGKKRYCQGPAVVFPTATETFVEENGSRIFRCIELNPNSGIHVMVIADYLEATKLIKSGTELFITGKDTPIYYPRPEHAIIKYDNENFIHYATAVPSGEGRYVLNKSTGKIDLRKGPDMLLLDPTKEIFVRRVLSKNESVLYYPGNEESLQINEELTQKSRSDSTAMVASYNSSLSADYSSEGTSMFDRGARKRSLVSDVVQRKSTYTPPRSLTLDNKYTGAVTISVWPGYCVQVVKKSGESRVEVGPKTVLLEYDESLTKLSLSTGKPKTTDRLFDTVYLKVAGNQVTDIVKVETSDSIEIGIKLALKVRFTGEPNNWFTVDNYVKECTDHVRSILRGVVKTQSVLEFTQNATRIIRDAILGVKPDNSPRTGCLFPQSGVHIHDVEILDVKVADEYVAKMIHTSQQDTIKGMLDVLRKTQASSISKEIELAERNILKEKQLTDIDRHKAAIDAATRKLELELAELNVNIKRESALYNSRLTTTELENKINSIHLIKEQALADLNININSKKLELDEKRFKMETDAISERMKSIDPKLVAAIEASNDRDALVKVVEHMGLGAYIKNDSVGATLSSILQGTSLETTAKVLGKALINE